MTDYYQGPVTAELKNWQEMAYGPYDIYWGDIYGDTKKRFLDGARVHTSEVKKVEEKDDCFIIITRNSVYRLWKCDKLGD